LPSGRPSGIDAPNGRRCIVGAGLSAADAAFRLAGLLM